MASRLLLAVSVAVFFVVAYSEALPANRLPGNDIPTNSFSDTDGGILLPSDLPESEKETVTDWPSDHAITTAMTDGDLTDSVSDEVLISESVTPRHFRPMRPPRPWLFSFWFRHPQPHPGHPRRLGPFRPTAADSHLEDVPYGNDMIFYGDGSLPEDSFRGGHGPRIPATWMRARHERPSFWFGGHGHPHHYRHHHHHHHHGHDGFAFDREMEGTRPPRHEREDGVGIMDGIRKFLNPF